MDIFSGYAINVSGRDFFNPGTELLQKIRWEAVKLVTHTLRQDFLLESNSKMKEFKMASLAFFISIGWTVPVMSFSISLRKASIPAAVVPLLVPMAKRVIPS